MDGTRKFVDGRHLVEKHIAKVAQIRTPVFGEGMDNFRVLNYFFFGFGVNRLVPKDKYFCLGKPAYCA